jgi:hypothetical protein
MQSKTRYTSQYIDNYSFDETYKNATVELLAEYNGTLKKLQTDVDGNLKTTASVSGVDGAIVDGASSSIRATVKDLANSNPLTVAITDASGDQITSFGGGTQYTEGDTDATITGTALMFETNTGTNTLGVVNSTNKLPVDGSGVTQPVSAASLPLPTGASTSALQSTGNTSLGTIAGAVSGTEMQVDVITMPTTTVQATQLDVDDLNSTDDVVTVTGGVGQTADVKMTLDGESVPVTGTFWQATQPVSAASLPLPSGAATSALQSTGNTFLGTIADAVSGTEMQVDVVTMPTTTVQATQLDVDNLNATDDVVTVTGGTGQTADVKVTLDGENVPVTGTFWQATQPVSATSLPLPTGAATSALQTQPGVDIGDVTVNNTTANPVPIQPPAVGYLTVAIDQTGSRNDVDIISTPLSSTVIVGQKAMTGSAVQLQTNTLTNGVIITAKSTNTANIVIGDSGVTTTENGSGNGYILEPGASVSFAGTNTNLLYAIGTTSDVLSFMGC